ncbi:MAG: hypothetical protein QW134_05610 [Nitrososphaeria archaeon]
MSSSSQQASTSAYARNDILITARNFRIINVANGSLIYSNTNDTPLSNRTEGSTRIVTSVFSNPFNFPINLTSVSVQPSDFQLNVTPSLPATIAPDGNESFTFTYHYPNHPYDGVVTITEYVNIPTVTVTGIDYFFHDLATGQNTAAGSENGYITTIDGVEAISIDFSCNGNNTQTLSNIQASTSGFYIYNISPNLPITLNCNGVPTRLSFDIKSPNKPYTGVLSITEIGST